jgi:OOP family OmpA-OmpF porin
MLKQTAFAALTLALGACTTGPAPGPGRLANPAQPGYVTSSGGVVKSGYGLCWHTSGWTPEMAVAPCDPVAIAQAPAKPVVVPKPVPAPEIKPNIAKPLPQPEPKRAPVIQRVALGTELLFDFDSAELRPAGRVKLDEIALKLHGADIESIDAIGHADRIASDAYNQALSEERAAAVKAYLASLGFDARKMRAEGHGESEPATGELCTGLGPENRYNLKLVRCLQPDRRVELEVRGVKGGT